jgi:chromosome segregation ATPase
MEDIKSEYSFLETARGGNVRELESKLSSQLKDLCERNRQLSRNNAELLRSAEIGWNAEVQIKKFQMTEAELGEEIKSLRFEREDLALQLREKENAAAKLAQTVDSQRAEIRALQAKAGEFEDGYRARSEELNRLLAAARAEEARLAGEMTAQGLRHEQTLAAIQERHEKILDDARKNFGAESSGLAKSARKAEAEIQELKTALQESQSVCEQYDIQSAELSRQLAQSRAEENRLAAELAESRRDFEQMMGVAQESFHAQLSDLGKVAWSAGAEIQSLKNDLNESRAESARLREEIAAQDESYRAQLADLARTGWESERELKETQKIHSELAAETAKQRAALEKTVSELKRLLETERAAHAHTKNREDAFRMEAAQASEQAKSFAVAAQEAEESKRRAVTEAQRRFEEQKAAVNGMSAELNVKIQDLRESRETVQKQMTVISELSRASQEKSAEAAALRAKIERADEQARAQAEQARAKDMLVAGMAREAAAKDELIQRQIKTLANLTKADKEKDLEIQRFRLAESSLNETVSELRRAGFERDQLRKELETHIARLSSQLDETQAASSHEILSLNTQLQSARAQLETARAVNEHLKSERDQARQAAEVRDHRAEDERAELERLNAALQQREYQLRQYAASVSDEKSEVLRRAKHLADEIRAASTLAPLKDYLALTEFELSKVEMQLRKTPVISIERPRLEASFNQMIEQRDFLKGAIANSQAQLDRQAAQLMKIAKPEKLSPIPPMPPRKTGV